MTRELCDHCEKILRGKTFVSIELNALSVCKINESKSPSRRDDDVETVEEIIDSSEWVDEHEEDYDGDTSGTAFYFCSSECIANYFESHFKKYLMKALRK